ncbi:hypothetical protein J41TS12_06640 [Paenibacillus antibioticophila]|uniref:Uncharacterized protein n=1 Tax=Paenibacillus antibioticophila TaxID=1274374 RepID=A0A920CFG6_9BACL|nr:hypothetical protein [Paenibacillus antibioticophila]GIO35803.1 hypothetical protein J41TS12_06640 [Paenibacillus antibioticophila]
MQWQEVRTVYPDQYVLLEILDSYTEDNIQYVEEVALVRAIQDPSEATSGKSHPILGRASAQGIMLR